jgi:hypothetical protein
MKFDIVDGEGITGDRNLSAMLIPTLWICSSQSWLPGTFGEVAHLSSQMTPRE